MLLVATVSVGGITYWGARAQITENQLQNGQVLASATAALASSAMRRGEDVASLQRLVTGFAGSPTVWALAVLDRDGVVLASNRYPSRHVLRDDLLRDAFRAELPVARALDETRLVAIAPIFADGRLRGAARLEVPFGEHLAWPGMFWGLMAIDCVILLLFVAFVLTRYVIRPLEALQQAAASVSAGDLSVQLAEKGAYELTSLATSFNAMTASVKDQLGRLEHQRQEIAASREQLIRSEKLASVGRLAAGVAHEVGNPLQAIIGFTEMLLGKGIAPAEQADFLHRIQGETQRIHRIVRELLDYARPVEDAVEPVSLAAVLEQSLLLVAPQKPLREVTIERRELDALPPAAANGSRIVQVLVNLLLNAADALAGKGTIRCEGQVAGSRVELLISNDGAPIPPEHRGRIFDPFFTTKDPGQGTGLGLSVAQSIVESYGGRLYLADREQTTFVISLHMWKDSAEQARSPKPEAC